MIEVSDLTKVYRLSSSQKKKMHEAVGRKVAVEGVSFTAEPGEIFCLLGPNGAGKTTTLRCIATLLKPTRGSISVDGYDTVKNGDAVRRSLAFLTNELKLDPQFSPRYLFSFFGHLHGMDDDSIGKRRSELFGYFGIDEFQDKKIHELSTGMKQKVSIAVSLVHDPDCIIFDEPTNGLDIITARAVTDYLKELKKMGKTLVISTHIMSEAEKLCDRLAIIMGGRCAFRGTLNEVLEATGTDNLEDAFFTLYRDQGADSDQIRDVQRIQQSIRKEDGHEQY